MGRPWLSLIGIVVPAVIVDQYTKQIAEAHIRGRGIVTVIDGFFDLRYTRNPGAFFSFGASLSDDIRRGFFIAATLLAVALILQLYRRTLPAQKGLRLGLVFLLAGALGNFVDRIRRGDVVDFLHLHYRDAFHWATFNAADVYIAVGVVFLLARALRPQHAKTQPHAC